MTTHPTSTEPLTELLWLEAGELMEAPLLLATQWWLTAAEALARAPKVYTPLGDHRPLVVPDSIEASDAPGLFA